MAKAYWVVCYRSISDDAAREKYTKLAVPAVLAAAGVSSLAASRPRRMSTASKNGPLWLSLKVSRKQSLHTIVGNTKRRSPFWVTEPSAT
jgi:hypothetical protein